MCAYEIHFKIIHKWWVFKLIPNLLGRRKECQIWVVSLIFVIGRDVDMHTEPYRHKAKILTTDLIRFCNAHAYHSLLFQMHRNTVFIGVCLKLPMNIWKSIFISGFIPINGRCSSDHFVGLQKTRGLRPNQSIISFKRHRMRWPVPGAHRQSHDFKWSPVTGAGRGDGSHHLTWHFLSSFSPAPAENRTELSGGRSAKRLDGSFMLAPQGATHKAWQASGPFRGCLRRTYRNKMMKDEWKQNHEMYSHCFLTNQYGSR